MMWKTRFVFALHILLRISPTSPCFWLLMAQSVPFVAALPRSEEYDISKYLYSTGDESSQYPVKEYMIHLAPSEDFERDELGNKQHHHDHVQPYFLRSDHKNGPRVVQFYSPYSGPCVNYKPKYLQLSKDVKDRTNATVEFHAVSCSDFYKVCQDQNVRDYPTIKAYRSSSIQGIKLVEPVTAESIGGALGISLRPKAANSKEIPMDTTDGPQSTTAHQRYDRDALGMAYMAQQHTQQDTFLDAALSCTSALETAIYPPQSTKNGKPLAEDRKAAFREWIDLLYWTLPPVWKIHIIVNDLRAHFDIATSGKDNLLQMVQARHDVIHDRVDNRRWTASCHRNSDGADVLEQSGFDLVVGNEAAFLCGFWNLLHVISIGVSERHKAVLGQRDRVSTAHAAKTIRDYIDKFITCEKCRHYFLEVYDKCGFNLCKRLKQPGGQVNYKNNHPRAPSEKSWNELALWLWELHNDVNVRLLREKEFQTRTAALGGGNYGSIFLTREQEDAIRWPSRESCPKCWRDDGSWDSGAVYEHLKQEYWPQGPQHFRYVVLERKAADAEGKNDIWTHLEVVLLQRYGLVVLVLAAYIVSFLYKRWSLISTGRHKKVDSVLVYRKSVGEHK